MLRRFSPAGASMSNPFRILVVAVLLSMAACAGPDVRLYEGASRPAAEIAVVTMPEQLEVATINGVEVPAAQGMWNRGDKRLEVLPGRYEVLVFYREVWQASGESDVLRSKSPALFVIDAQAGHQYRIDYAHPGTYDDAKKLVQDFRGWSEDRTTGVRTASVSSGLKFGGGLAGVFAPATGNTTLVQDAAKFKDGVVTQTIQPLQAAPSASAPEPAAAPVVAPLPPTASAGQDRDWVNLMKGWWKQAGAQEHRDFLRWVGDGSTRTESGAGGDWLNTVKGWWAQASGEQRRDFLRWVGEQP
ncbi:MAG: DUF2057 family protein [Solimonas sp.]